MARTPATKPKPMGSMKLLDDMIGKKAQDEERLQQEKAARALLDDDDDSDIMWSGGRSDRLCGVVEEEGWYYVICTENTRTNGRSRPNFERFRGQGYKIAKLPDGSEANWPEISKAILCIPLDAHERTQRMYQKRAAENGGMIPGKSEEFTQEGDSGMLFKHTRKGKKSSAVDLGIPIGEDAEQV